MPTFEEIRRQAEALEIDLEVEDGMLNMHKRGAEGWRFGSLQPYDSPVALGGAQEWIDRYRAFVQQADQARSKMPRQYIHEESHHLGMIFHCKHCKQWLSFPSEIGVPCPGPAQRKRRILA